MSVIGSNIIAGASGTVETGYQIARSLRFNSADTAYLTRTQSAGNRRTWHFKAWVKRSKLGTKQNIFGHIRTSPSNVQTYLSFLSGDTLEFFVYSGTTIVAQVTTTQVFRDVSAYMQIDLAVDTTQATASNRVKLFVNGTQITALSTATYMAQNYDTFLNEASQSVGIGRVAPYDTSEYSDFYLSDVHFIDGQALTPSSFGETDANTGIWVPKAYTGTYGTNGFWLKLDDNSGTTSTTLGKDSSGNSNNWTPNNFSVTAGVGNDSLVDSPTNYGTDTGAGGEVRGNYCTWNALKVAATTLSNGNLDGSFAASSTSISQVHGSIPVSTGKWYFEVTFLTNTGSTGGATLSIGVAKDTANIAAFNYYSGNAWHYNGGGSKVNTAATAYGSTYTTNDVIGVAVDMDAGKIWFSKNGTWQASGSPTAGTNAAFTDLSGNTVTPFVTYDQSNNAMTFTANFGQRPFAYTAPSGFKALCTQNLPTPAIGASASTLASKNFDILTYTGNGATRTLSGLGFQPDISWIKVRNVAYDHRLWDAVRGVGLKGLYTSLNSAEGSGDAFGYISAFTSDGFTVISGSTSIVGVNESTSAYAAWNWKANGAGSSNNAGSITSTVSANTTAGVSVVTYTGNGSSSQTIGHGLGVAPSMIIVKRRGAADTWRVYHSALGNTKFLNLNETAAAGTASTVWNNTSPTSTVFSIGTDSAVNSSSAGNTFVAYAFAEIAGFSKFGSYTGNGNADGPFVYCGFRPRWIMIKRSDTAGEGWPIQDTARFPTNVVTDILAASSSASEATLTSIYNVDILSNGFKIRNTNAPQNANGSTYIFAAFAEAPFNYARAR